VNLYLQCERKDNPIPSETKIEFAVRAIRDKFPETLEYLLKNGVSANSISESGLSLLIWAITKNEEKSVEILLKYNVTIAHSSYKPHELAVHKGNPKIIEMLLKYHRVSSEEANSLLKIAVEKSDLVAIRLILTYTNPDIHFMKELKNTLRPSSVMNIMLNDAIESKEKKANEGLQKFGLSSQTQSQVPPPVKIHPMPVKKIAEKKSKL
jgi:ankyrin repeat protein